MTTIPSDFTTLSVAQAIELAAYPADRLAILKTNRAFNDGDHWQNGDGWIGPWPIPQPESKRAHQRFVQWMQAQIRRGFLSKNAIKECIDREVAGVVGIEARWGFAPTEIELPANATPDSEAAKAAIDRAKAKAQRAEDLATRWWNKRSGQALVQDAAAKLLTGAEPVAEVTGRYYIPASMLADEVDDAGKKTGRKRLNVSSIEDAIDLIHFEVLDAESGRVVQHPDTLAEIGLKPTKRGEQQVIEVTYLDQTNASPRKTIIATIGGDKTVATPLDLGGRLTMLTVTRKAFLSVQTRESQRALNYSTTTVKRNVETAGFLREIILNAHIPGHYEGEGDDRHYVADPIEQGPTSLNAFSGIEQEDAAGNKTLTTPNVVFQEPVDPTPTITAKHEFYADILDACHQKHVMISGDATASGESRIQARADHIAELRLTQAPIEQLGRWMLETLIVLADALANNGNQSGVLNGLRANFSCYLDAGPVDPADRAQNLAEMNAGALSKTSTIERNGTVDVDAEVARIRSEPNAGLDAELKRAQIYAAWVAGSVGEAFAAKRAGLSPQEVQELVTAQTDTVPVKQ